MLRVKTRDTHLSYRLTPGTCSQLPFRESAVRFVEDLASTVMAALTSLLQSIALDQTLLCERLVALCCAIVDEARRLLPSPFPF